VIFGLTEINVFDNSSKLNKTPFDNLLSNSVLLKDLFSGCHDKFLAFSLDSHLPNFISTWKYQTSRAYPLMGLETGLIGPEEKLRENTSQHKLLRMVQNR